MAEAKEVTAFAGKYKEAKRCRAYDAVQALSATLTFGPRLDELLSLVRGRLGEATAPAIRAKLEMLLAAVVRGVALNPSVTPAELAAWLVGLLDEAMGVEEAARARARTAAGAATTRTATSTPAAAGAAATPAGGGDGADASGDGAAHTYLFSHFALGLLNSSLRRGVLAGRDAGTLKLLAPLLPQLVRCLHSRHMGTVQVRRSTWLAACLTCSGFEFKSITPHLPLTPALNLNQLHPICLGCHHRHPSRHSHC